MIKKTNKIWPKVIKYRKILTLETELKKKFFIDSFGYLLYFLNKVVFSKEVYPPKLKIFIWDKIFIPITYIIDFFSFYKLGKNIVFIIQKK